MRTIAALGAALAGALAALLPSAGAPTPAEIVVYSARSHYNQEPAFDAFTKKTGIQVRIHGGNAPELFERLRAEGDRTPADVLITVDAGYLWNAARAGLLAKVDSPELLANIPAHLRDPEQRWFGLTTRARTVSPTQRCSGSRRCAGMLRASSGESTRARRPARAAFQR